ncbi:MAG: hypothetical protein ACREFO_11510 [Acetobacteraceae bacterium]
MAFDFTINASSNAIFHDDDISLFAAGDTIDLLPTADANPTSMAESDRTLGRRATPSGMSGRMACRQF